MCTFMDLTGQQFGRLTVIERSKANKKVVYWICRCSCGIEVDVRACSLRGGISKSCGCLNREISATHGLSSHPAYGSWLSMNHRCHTPGFKGYERYGGRGITVCDEWRGDPTKFIEWSEQNGFEPRLSIDRIDNNGPYSPDNCRWTNGTVQSLNKGLPSNNKSGVKGVRWDERGKRWDAAIGVNRKSIHLGRFLNFDDAVKARKAAEEKYFAPILEEAHQ